jgi:hypothetical protein
VTSLVGDHAVEHAPAHHHGHGHGHGHGHHQILKKAASQVMLQQQLTGQSDDEEFLYPLEPTRDNLQEFLRKAADHRQAKLVRQKNPTRTDPFSDAFKELMKRNATRDALVAQGMSLHEAGT